MIGTLVGPSLGLQTLQSRPAVQTELGAAVFCVFGYCASRNFVMCQGISYAPQAHTARSPLFT